MLTTIKNAAISKAILDQLAAGKSLPEAIDAVLGQDAYSKIAGALYDALNE